MPYVKTAMPTLFGSLTRRFAAALESGRPGPAAGPGAVPATEEDPFIDPFTAIRHYRRDRWTVSRSLLPAASSMEDAPGPAVLSLSGPVVVTSRG